MTTVAAPPASLRDRFSRWLEDELAPQHFIASLNAAVIIYLLEVILTLSMAALIFSGKLAGELPYAVSFILIGDVLLVAVVTGLSSYSGSIAGVQDTPGVILAVAAASLAAALPAATSDQLFATVVVLIAGSTMAVGLVYLLVAIFKLGGLVRFLPYPVMGGFLAGTGWLLTVGGISVATNLPSSVGLLRPAMLARWLPALVLGLLILLAVKRWKSPLVPAGVFVLALAAFYGVMWMLDMSPATLASEGWLPGPFLKDFVWRFPLDARTLSQVSWPALLGVIPIAAPAILISLIALLLNASSLELVIKRDIDLNRELTVAGAANLLAGLTGGLIGYHAVSSTALGDAFGKGRRMPGLLVALFLFLTVFVGPALLSVIPNILLGALLAYIGLALLDEWVVRAWSAFSKIDFAIIVSILFVIAAKDFLWGIGLGLVMTVVLFVVSYSRISSVRHELSGTAFRSRVSRSLRELELLQANGDQLLIFRLQGFIFFGTANNLFEQVRERVRRTGEQVRFLLLDFEHVTGLDSTGLLSFSKMLLFTRENRIELVLTRLTSRARDQMLHAGFTEQTEGLHLFANIDRGVEWCEDRIVASMGAASVPAATLQDQLAAIVPDKPRIAALQKKLHRRELVAGEYIIREGDEPDALFLVESGQLTTQLEKQGRETVRLETMQAGRMVGELGFFLGTRRNALVVADCPSVVYFLTRQEWNEIKENDPETALTLNSVAIHLLGQRVSYLTRVMDALQY